MKIHQIFSTLIKDLSDAPKLVDGTQLLFIYYIAIALFFVFDVYFRRHIHKVLSEDDKSLSASVMKFFEFYQKHGFIVINTLLLVICLVLTIYQEGFSLEYFLEIILSFVFFTILMKLLLRIFVNEDGYSNITFMRYLHLVCYMILGNYFVYLMPFVKLPKLWVSYIGLCLGLYFCLVIMIQAIFNPEILRRGKQMVSGYSEAFGILKGMLAVVICILLLEYMMIFACYYTNPDFYTVGTDTRLNAWNLFYYLIITFSTIGYGDIYPVVYDGIVYSQLTAIIIGLSSMFTTGCFVAAVISTANNIALSSKKDKETDKED